MMQRQYTVEVRIEGLSQRKAAKMKKALRQAAKHLYANAVLLAPRHAAAPQVYAFSDDFFEGHHKVRT